MERTYIMIKPDGVQRGLVGRIIKRFESAGFQLVGLKMCMPTKQILSEHYSELSERPFFSTLLAYVGSGPVVCMVWKGEKAVARARNLIGKTDPANATSGTIRADMAAVPGRNVIHGADSSESAEREISIWFGTKKECKCKEEEPEDKKECKCDPCTCDPCTCTKEDCNNLIDWELALKPWIEDKTPEDGDEGKKDCNCDSCKCDPCTCGEEEEDKEDKNECKCDPCTCDPCTCATETKEEDNEEKEATDIRSIPHSRAEMSA